jgi:hypothetical protein
VSTQIIRCPICLLSQPVKKNVSPDKVLHCGNCQRDFTVKNGLPLKEGGMLSYATAPATTTTNASVTNVEPATTRNVVITWIFGAIIGLMVIKTSRSFIAPYGGPEFLTFYFFLFMAVWLSLVAIRKIWEDSAHVTLIALFIFEGVGLIRYIDASAAGMHKFGYMFMMMAVGAVLLFSRYDHTNGNNWYDSSCSSCSSCSGCGGGGGCGGCGD